MNKYIDIGKVISGDIIQKIKCQVYDCKYCNCYKDLCDLKEIEVVNCTSGESPKELTMCNSYKGTKSK